MSKTFVYIKRDDGSVIDIPEKHVEQTLKLHKSWKVVGKVEAKGSGFLEAPVTGKTVTPPKAEKGFECPIDGEKFDTEKALLKHKETHA